jgi:ankyrin repeat protein
LLLKHGAKVNDQDRFGRSALMDAAFKGQVKTVKFLLANGANPRLKDDDGKTAWDLAKENGHTEILPLLEVGTRSKR